MDFWQTIRVLLRRWYVAVPTFLAGLAVAGFAYTVAPATYESSCVLALTSPLTGGTEVASGTRRPRAVTNPLLNFDPSLSQTTALLIQELRSPDVARTVGAFAVEGAHVDVNNGTSNPELLQSGPFVFITSTGRTPDVAEELTQRVAAIASRILSERQDELLAPPSTHIEVHEVVEATDGARLMGKPARAAAASLALAALFSLSVVYGVESYKTGPRRTRPRPRAPVRGDPVGAVAPARRPRVAPTPRPVQRR